MFATNESFLNLRVYPWASCTTSLCTSIIVASGKKNYLETITYGNEYTNTKAICTKHDDFLVHIEDRDSGIHVES